MMTFCGAIFDRDVLTVVKSCFLQALPECRHKVRHIVERIATEKSNHRHGRLLRVHGQRPRCRAAEQRDELSPPHELPSDEAPQYSTSLEHRRACSSQRFGVRTAVLMTYGLADLEFVGHGPEAYLGG